MRNRIEPKRFRHLHSDEKMMAAIEADLYELQRRLDNGERILLARATASLPSPGHIPYLILTVTGFEY